MPALPTALDPVHSTDQCQDEAPFTAWPAPGRGFMVLDMRTMAWAAGPFRTPAEACEATDRLNERVVRDAHAKGSSAMKGSQK